MGRDLPPQDHTTPLTTGTTPAVSPSSGNNLRFSKQCAARWTEVLTNKRSRTAWTQEEIDNLQAFVILKGKRWTNISLLMSGRTPQDLKNRYNSLHRTTLQKVKETETTTLRKKNSPARCPRVRFEFGSNRILFSFDKYFPERAGEGE